MRLLLKLLLVVGAVYVATVLVPGIEVRGEAVDYLVVAVILALVNLLVKPVVTLLSLPFVLLTLGLFLLVVNAAMLGLTAALTDRLSVDGFWSAVVGALVISVVTWGGERALGLKQD
ncbi:MAG TPA: phage holin family protein [Mycobacteriales bacterium]|nr:phage holin family protein [Mycobacteriales bacterium]